MFFNTIISKHTKTYIKVKTIKVENMKKLRYFVLIVGVCIVLAGCSRLYKNAQNSIAEVRQNIYIGENESMVASFMAGKREEDYVINGVATPLIEFGVIAVSLQNVNISYAKIGSFALISGKNTYTGELQLNPFDNSYVADIGKIIDTDDDISLTVTIGSFTSDISLQKNNTAWKLDSNDALKSACKALKTELKSWGKKSFDGEVYVKIIHDSKISSTDYFWYVSFVNTTGTMHSVIIHPISGEILAKK